MQNLEGVSYPFYDQADDRHNVRHWCDTSSPWAQPVTSNKLPPWVIRDPGGAVSAVWAYNLTTDRWGLITSLVTITTNTYGSESVISYNWESLNLATTFAEYTTKGGAVVGDTTWPEFAGECDLICLEIDAGANTWYGEWFTVTSELEVGVHSPGNKNGALYFDWTDDRDIGDIPYSAISWGQKLWLPTDVGRPSYEIVRDGETDGTGKLNPNTRRMTKRPEFTALVPEYIVDAFAAMAIHATAILEDQYNRFGPIHDIVPTVSWEQSDCLGLLTVSYHRGIIRRKNCV